MSTEEEEKVKNSLMNMWSSFIWDRVSRVAKPQGRKKGEENGEGSRCTLLSKIQV